MNLDTYTELIDLVKDMQDKGVHGVFVFKPDCYDTDDAESHPDMIVSTSNDPGVIAALLGNSITQRVVSGD